MNPVIECCGSDGGCRPGIVICDSETRDSLMQSRGFFIAPNSYCGVSGGKEVDQLLTVESDLVWKCDDFLSAKSHLVRKSLISLQWSLVWVCVAEACRVTDVAVMRHLHHLALSTRLMRRVTDVAVMRHLRL